MNTFEEKRERKKDRYLELAQKNREVAENNSISNVCGEKNTGIPFGQPILVGHHSEQRHRKHLKRIDAKVQKGFDASNKAEYYEGKVRAVENNKAIFSDDPEAVTKLKVKIEKLDLLQQQMKATNKIVKSKKKNYTQEQKMENLKILFPKSPESNLYKLFNPDYCGRIGFASYQLTNNNANIRRLKKRLEELQRKSEEKTKEYFINDVKVIENTEENRIQLFFDSIPDVEIRTKLKQNGFRWSRYNGCWQRHLNNAGRYATKYVLVKTT